MKNNWNDITIAEYKQIVAIQNSNKSNEEKIVSLIALLNGNTEDEVWNMPMGKMNELTKQLSFINEFPALGKIKYNTLKIGKWDLECDIKMNKFAVAQYMDFQSYWSQRDKDLARVISVFYLPRDLKYADGYDIEELIHDIEQNISIVDANEIAFFLIRKLVKSTKTTALFLDIQAKRVAKKMRKAMKM